MKIFVPLHEWENIHYLFYITCAKIQSLKGGTVPPTQKAPNLACFVLYLNIINIFLKNNICILK